MSCFTRFFKIHKSFDLPVLNSVPGVVTKRKSDDNFDTQSIASYRSTIEPPATPQPETSKVSSGNGSIHYNRQTSQVTINSTSLSDDSSRKNTVEHHNFEYGKILETMPIPESMTMKCNPKPTIEDEYFCADEYPRISETHTSAAPSQDGSDRQKADSGIETDEIEEANKSVSFSEKVQILGFASSEFDGSLSSENTNESNEQQQPDSHNSIDSDEIDVLHAKDDGTEEPTKTRTRRKEGVIADSIDQKSTRDFDLDLKVYEKSAETEDLIKSAIMANDFLNNMMDAERLQAVVNAMIPQVLKANNYVIKEGDTGNQFFVSAEGVYEVIKKGECIKTFGPGVVFGELAILYKARRFASIKVTTDAFVWALDRRIFQKIMMKTGSQEREQNVKFLKSVKALKDCSDDVLHKLGDLLKREFYATGSQIIRQGDQGDKFYIIRGGSVTVSKTSTTGENRIVAMLKRGEYFGEQALINKARRLANIIANAPGTECLTLDRQAFTKYLGTLAELKQKPVDQIQEEGDPQPEVQTNVVNPLYDHILLSDLEIVGTLGVGGFGRVELVQYDKKDTFALKILKKHEVASQGQIEHAYSEKDIMSSCDSSFIVKLYKTYRNKKYLYFLMEACLGGDVWTQLQKTKFFEEKTARFVTACVVEAFDYLHTRGIIYRDLKPENLMIDADGYVKLVDFGFAKRISPNCRTWTFAGTPEYVAPEIILNKGHDRAVDYWALGVFIHEILIGKPPFRGKDHMKTYNLILRGIDVVQMPHKIPKSAQNLIRGLCRQTPTDRLGYQKKGIADIKRHTWFDVFNWEKLEDRSMSAPTILKRPIKSNIDLSNFDEYPRDRDEPPDDVNGWDAYF